MKENMYKANITGSLTHDLPYRCPKCSNSRRFPTFSELRTHLEYEHSAFFSVRQTTKIHDHRKYPSFEDKLDMLLFEAEHLEKQLESAKKTELQNKHVYRKMCLGNRSSLDDKLYKLKNKDQLEASYSGRDLLNIIERLKFELNIKQAQLDKAMQDLQNMAAEKCSLLQKTHELSLQLDGNVEYLAMLKTHLEEKEYCFRDKENEVQELSDFLQAAAEKEVAARLELERFINDLLIRTDRAESEANLLRSVTSSNSVCGRCLSSQNSIPKLFGSSQGFQEQSNLTSPGPSSIQDPSTPRGVSNFNPTYRSTPKTHHVIQEKEDVPILNSTSHLAHLYSNKHRASYSDSVINSGANYKLAASSQPLPENYHPSPRADDSNRSWQSSQLPLDENGILWDNLPQRSMSSPSRLHAQSKSSNTILEENYFFDSDSVEIPHQAFSKEPRFVKDFSKNATLPKKLREAQVLNSSSSTRGSSFDDAKQIPVNVSLSSKNEKSSRWQLLQEKADQEIILTIFKYLTPQDLFRCAQVCRMWRELTHHPYLWRRVKIKHCRITAKVLQNISKWSCQLLHLSLEGLKLRKRETNETIDDYQKNIRGSLEVGLEDLLLASSTTLLSLAIIDCGSLLTDRSLWLASCYNRCLQKVAYISHTDPVGPEVLWALGAGCKEISTLIVPPLHPNQKPERFTDHCVSLLSKCWPSLKVLCIGGKNITKKGLIVLASRCQNLEVLELDHIQEVNDQLAWNMCQEGLQKLQALDFTFTPVEAETLVTFKNGCSQLHSFSVHIRISDYFQDTRNPHNVDSFKRIVSRLKALKKNPGFSANLHIKASLK